MTDQEKSHLTCVASHGYRQIIFAGTSEPADNEILATNTNIIFSYQRAENVLKSFYLERDSF